MDRSVGTTASTGGTGTLGGAMASPGKVAGSKVAGNDVWIKSGTYSITSASTNIAGGCVSDSTGGVSATNICRWEGYSATRGDKAAMPLLQASGAISTFTLFSGAAGFIEVDSIAVDGALKTSSRGLSTSNSGVNFTRCKVLNCTNNGCIVTSVNSFAALIEATGCTTVAAISLTDSRGAFLWAHDNTADGISLVSSASNHPAAYCISNNNGGKGFAISGRQTLIHCVAYGNTGNGFEWAANNFWAINCVAYGNTGYGFVSTASNAFVNMMNCATGSNTAGATSNITATIAGAIVLTANPYDTALISAANTLALAFAAFRPNNTAGGGALLRGAGLFAYSDVGSSQHQDASSGGPVGANFRGGFQN